MTTTILRCILSAFLAGFCVQTTLAIAGPAHDKVVVCYIGAWAVYRPNRGSFSIEHIDPTLCTHVIYSFAGLDVAGDGMRSLDSWQDLEGKGGYMRFTVLKQNYPHLKTILAIGGWNEGSTNYSALVKDPRRRSNFVRNSLEFIKKYNFDGLDLDWEFPGKRGGSPDDKLNFLLLVKELRPVFSKHKLHLSAAFGAGKDTIDVAYDVEALSLYLDFIHMMCYDYHGAWDQRTGANAPLRSNDVLNVEYSINYMLKLGAPAHKLVLGIPFYGRTFISQSEGATVGRKPKLGMPASNLGFMGPLTRENGFMGYNEICLELKNATANWTTYWDNQSMTPFAISGDRVIAYDDRKSIREKVDFAMGKKLGGVMVWSVDTDDFHGDCAEFSKNGQFHNFPLLREINNAIEDSTFSAKPESDNEIDHESGANSIIFYELNLLVLVVSHYLLH